MDDRRPLEVPTREARQGSNEGVVRYVLAVSITLVIVAFAIIYYIYR